MSEKLVEAIARAIYDAPNGIDARVSIITALHLSGAR